MWDSNNPMSALNQLPLDLVEAILVLLPPKSLGRFRSVSKRWYSLISSPEFIKTHIRAYTKNNPNPNPTHFLYMESDESLYSLDIKHLYTQPIPATLTAKRLNFQEPLFEIRGSCNGLLLATDMDYNLHLVNPTTQKTLNVIGGESYGGKTYGFGYDSSTDDYKVISISRMGISDSDIDTNIVRVYSLRNNSWNMLPNFPYQQHNHYGSGVLLNNNLHWVVRSIHLKMTIAAFSLASEKFHEIELPDSINYIQFGGMSCNLYALGGKLVVVEYDEFKYELWVMEDYGVPKSWRKLCIFQNYTYIYSELFAQVSNRDILLANKHEFGIFIYNMDERRYTSVVTIKGCIDALMVYGTYVESLESLDRFPLGVQKNRKNNLERFR